MKTDNHPISMGLPRPEVPGLNHSFDAATGTSPVFVDATGCRKRVMQCLVGFLTVGGLTYTGLVGMSVGSAQHSPLGTFEANPLPYALADPGSRAAPTPSPTGNGHQGITANPRRAGDPIGWRGEPVQGGQALPATSE